MRSAKSALGQLVGKLGASEFLKTYWPDHSFLTHESIDRLPDFFSKGTLSDFDSLASKYTGSFQVNGGKGRSSDQFSVSGPKPRDLYKFGLTVYLENVVNFVPGLGEWLASMERELGLPSGNSRIGVFASPTGQGLRAHYDSTANIMIQIRGRKRIRIAPNEISDPPEQYNPGFTPHSNSYPIYPNGFPMKPPVKMKLVELRPGSVLFMPRGTWHETMALRGESLGASIIFTLPSTIDRFLSFLKQHLLQLPEWRRPLLSGSHRGETERHLQSMVRNLRDYLPQLPVEEILDQRIQSSTRLQRNPAVEITIKKMEADFYTFWGTHIARLQIPKKNLPLLKWLSGKKEAFTVQEAMDRFPGLSVREAHQMLTVLTQATALRHLGFVQLES